MSSIIELALDIIYIICDILETKDILEFVKIHRNLAFNTKIQELVAQKDIDKIITLVSNSESCFNTFMIEREIVSISTGLMIEIYEAQKNIFCEKLTQNKKYIQPILKKVIMSYGK